MSILCHFRALLGAWPRLTPLDPHLKVMPPWPRLIGRYICAYLLNLKDNVCTFFPKKCMQILPCIGELYYRFKQSVPESESRQFGRLRLRLLARCHDSGRLRLRTPGSLTCAISVSWTSMADEAHVRWEWKGDWIVAMDNDGKIDVLLKLKNVLVYLLKLKNVL